MPIDMQCKLLILYFVEVAALPKFAPVSDKPYTRQSTATRHGRKCLDAAVKALTRTSLQR